MKSADIVIPAHNEAKILNASLNILYAYLKDIKDIDWTVIIGENGSTDNTYQLAKNLMKKYPRLKVIHSNMASRDTVLKSLWGNSQADVLAYMDADMSVNPRFVKELIYSIAKEGYDIATGSRLKKGAKLKRSQIRKIMSILYNFILLPILLPTGVKDAQCGFKAINQRVAKEILPKLVNANGFLDTELLAVAKYKKYKVKEFPVEWTDADRKSTMNVQRNILNFWRNIFATRKKILTHYYD